MAQAVLQNQKRVLPCSVFLEGEHGVKGVFMGVLVKLGSGGVEKIYELPLDSQEKALFTKSGAAVEKLIQAIL